MCLTRWSCSRWGWDRPLAEPVRARDQPHAVTRGGGGERTHLAPQVLDEGRETAGIGLGAGKHRGSLSHIVVCSLLVLGS